MRVRDQKMKKHNTVKSYLYESWIARNWRPLCGAVYLLICLTDFVVMPIYCQVINSRYTPDKIIEMASTMKSDTAQVAAITVLRQGIMWTPITLEGAGVLHIAFGALLSAAAWTRGKEKEERVRNISDVTKAIAEHNKEMREIANQ